jgi:hypothetical protein
MRHQRIIELDDPEQLTQQPPELFDTGHWERTIPIKSPRSSGYEKRWRDGDRLIIERCVHRTISVRYGTETRREISLVTIPLIVDFNDILEAVQVEIDDDWGTQPWDDCDGYEHVIADADEYQYAKDSSGTARGIYRMRNSHYQANGLLLLTDTAQEGLYRYHRLNGASKQVAREMVAVTCRQTLDLLVEWYSEGWQWYYVTCEFDGYEDNCSGFLNEEDAKEHGSNDCARNVAYLMGQAGHIIVNRPVAWYRTRDEIEKECRAGYQYNLNLQNWKHDG